MIETELIARQAKHIEELRDEVADLTERIRRAHILYRWAFKRQQTWIFEAPDAGVQSGR